MGIYVYFVTVLSMAYTEIVSYQMMFLMEYQNILYQSRAYVEDLFLCMYTFIYYPAIINNNPSNNINYTLVIIYGLILDDLSIIIIPKFTSQINCWFRVAFGNKILGYPVLIDDVKYHRNALLFNVCLVFDPDTDTQSYEPIVRKLSYLFRNLEVISPPQV